MAQKALVMTFTGEPFQPVRLYYEVVNPAILRARFERLRCLQYDQERDRWCWYYEHEAKRLNFEKSYNAIPKNARPLILGYFKFEGQQVWLDLRSVERAVVAAQFFSEKINQRTWRAVRVRLVNHLFKAPKEDPEAVLDPSAYLDTDAVTIQDEQAFQADLEKISAQYPDQESRSKAIRLYLDRIMRQPLPEVEEFTLDLDELGGMDQFMMALRMRHIVAVQHWQGNTRFTRLDVMKRLMDQEPDRLAIEL